MREPRHTTGESTSDALVQSPIATPIYQDAVGTVTGMQDDVDPTYSMRRFLEDIISSYCCVLEKRYNEGQAWPAAAKISRGGINPKGRAAGDTTTLQSWVSLAARSRLYGTVNGMKTSVPSYTLRDFLEAAVNRHISHLRLQYADGRLWPPRPHLRRGRRGAAEIPMEYPTD